MISSLFLIGMVLVLIGWGAPIGRAFSKKDRAPGHSQF